jgi:hypothetical protein
MLAHLRDSARQARCHVDNDVGGHATMSCRFEK